MLLRSAAMPGRQRLNNLRHGQPVGAVCFAGQKVCQNQKLYLWPSVRAMRLSPLKLVAAYWLLQRNHSSGTGDVRCARPARKKGPSAFAGRRFRRGKKPGQRGKAPRSCRGVNFRQRAEVQRAVPLGKAYAPPFTSRGVWIFRRGGPGACCRKIWRGVEARKDLSAPPL